MSTTKHDLLSLLFIYKKYPLLNLILVLPENQWAAGPAKVTIGLYLDWSTSRSLRGDCEEFCFRIFAEKCKQRFCEAAEVFRALLRGHMRPFNQKWWCIERFWDGGYQRILVIFSKISVQQAVFTSFVSYKESRHSILLKYALSVIKFFRNVFF